jgi:hypothetical protein
MRRAEALPNQTGSKEFNGGKLRSRIVPPAVFIRALRQPARHLAMSAGEGADSAGAGGCRALDAEG